MLIVNQARIEYLHNPIGIDREKPCFSYTLSGDSKCQSAYRIQCAYDEEFRKLVYDTGKVMSHRMSGIPYEGSALKSRDRIHIRIKVWDENNAESSWYKDSYFEMGLLHPSDWSAEWVTGDYKPRKSTRYPVDCFKKEFSVQKKIDKARLYITACGLYEAKLNGQTVSEFCLAPGCTDYRKRLQYHTYDVAACLAAENCLEVQLADGWFRGSIGCFGPTNVFGRQTKLLCQLEITYLDGSKDVIASNESFDWCNDGPIRFADLKDGEIVEADKKPSYAGKARIAREDRRLTASNNVMAAAKEALQAKLITTPSGKQVLDFGQNIAGFIVFTITGKKGQKIHIRMGEILGENGEFTQGNLQVMKPVKEFGKVTEIMMITGNVHKVKGQLQPTPLQEIHFTCSGNEDCYRTTFAVFGFRYALVDTEVSFRAEQFKAIAVYSDMEATGDFHCSNEMVNKLVENTRWSMKSNFLDIPTDCPTRERLGWTGDAQVFFNTASYFMNVAPFFRKWLKDIEDAQMKNGVVPAVVPFAGMDIMYKKTGGSVGWADAAVLLVYRFWKRYQDNNILKEYYPMMRKYAMFMIQNTGHKDKKAGRENPYNQYTYEKGMHLGEWLEPEEFRDKIYGGGTLHTEECTAYLHYTMMHMAEIAQELGETADKALYSQYAEGAEKAYDWLFLQQGIPDTDRQAKLVRPIALGLVRGEKKKEMERRLLKAVENRQYKIGTGFLSTPFVLQTLTEAGELETAYRMLENEEAPGWLAEVKAGATTIWEDWEGKDSHNHYSPGVVCQWLFDTVAGIRPDGENHFIIAPRPGGSLQFAGACYKSIYGEVSVKWSKEEEQYCYEIVIPCNTTADIILPKGKKERVCTGSYRYKEEAANVSQY